MNKRQYYLQKLAEEALEVATAAMKCIQFGDHSRNPSQPDSLSNIDHLVYELRDLDGAVRAAQHAGFLVHGLSQTSFEHSDKKIDKINKYFEVCKQLGTVVE